MFSKIYLSADYPVEFSTADSLLENSYLLGSSVARLDTLNEPSTLNDDLDGSFFDASSETFASLPADLDAIMIPPGQADEAGCSEPQYAADLCCKGPIGPIIDEDDKGERIYSELRSCLYILDVFFFLF